MANFPVIDDARLSALERRFFEVSQSLTAGGMALAVWQGEREQLHLQSGSCDRRGRHSWTEDTLVPVWSCTKGPAAVACLLALQEQGGALETPVVDFWPAFGGGGKDRITMGEILSHQGGLAALETPVTMEDHAAVCRAIENQRPLWQEGHGYHPRTFGALIEECVRRLTGASSLGAYWREELAEPLGWDVWMGLPATEDARVAEVFPGRLPHGISSEEDRFYQALGEPSSLSARAFNSPGGWSGVRSMNQPEVWRHGNPAMGGVASARGLASFYAFLASGARCSGEPFFAEPWLKEMETPRVQGQDQVLLRETAFGPGLMKDPVDEAGGKRRRLFGPSVRAFGHAGAGGSLAFADPDAGLGFACVMNQMVRTVFPTGPVLSLVDALYGEC